MQTQLRELSDQLATFKAAKPPSAETGELLALKDLTKF
jgi:hypothetical protein